VTEDLHGLPYTSLAAHMREYLTVLGPLLRGEDVSFRGEHVRVEGGCTVPGAAPVPVLVGALSPRMVQAAGELAVVGTEAEIEKQV
jgi:5,10-methylenetetrahydromethanopterin reductase